MKAIASATLMALLTLDASAHAVDEKHIPLGDGKISSMPAKGYVMACEIPHGGGGAHHAGQWINGNTWDATRKIFVRGNNVIGGHLFDVESSQGTRTIGTNDIPEHGVGDFPIRRDDPAWQIDHNPNAIAPQSIKIGIPTAPVFADQVSCVPMGPVAVMLDGVVMYNALDDMSRDAVAHEVQDTCSGHPQRQGQYHYHGPSACMKEQSQPETLVGYALDGFGIYSGYDRNGKELSNADLDECHGRTSPILWDGKVVNMYHYVLTKEYPYSVGCFRGTPIRSRVHDNIPSDAPENRQGTRFGHQPPAEAIHACDGRSDGATCTINTPRGDRIDGNCNDLGGTTACIPSRHN